MLYSTYRLVRYICGKTRWAWQKQWSTTRAWTRYWRSYFRYKAVSKMDGRSLIAHMNPQLNEDTALTQIDPAYFYMDTWAFQRIVEQKPASHVDVGSAAEFVGCLSKVIDVTMVDIRPLSVSLDTLKFKEGSILALPFADASLSSLSSICVIEHIGLGRYGDPLDPNGTESAIKEIKRVVKPGGHVYISVPTAAENMVEFNAHRRFTEKYILEQFAPLKLVESRYIYGNEFVDKWRPEYGTGCYYFRA